MLSFSQHFHTFSQHPLIVIPHLFCNSGVDSAPPDASFPPRPTDNLCRAAHLPYNAPGAVASPFPLVFLLVLLLLAPKPPWPLRMRLPARTSSSGCSLINLCECLCVWFACMDCVYREEDMDSVIRTSTPVATKRCCFTLFKTKTHTACNTKTTNTKTSPTLHTVSCAYPSDRHSVVC